MALMQLIVLLALDNRVLPRIESLLKTVPVPGAGSLYTRYQLSLPPHRLDLSNLVLHADKRGTRWIHTHAEAFLESLLVL